MNENYRRVAQPPPHALKRIEAGRLKGKTDINPQWRYEAMTEVYGLCGIGWKFEVARRWTEAGPDGQVFAFVDINLYVATEDQTIPTTWSEAIPGNGGSMLVDKEKAGLHANDEAFKMATTDALSTAMKMIGVGADIYAGRWDGSKYNTPAPPATKGVTPEQLNDLKKAWAKKYAELFADCEQDAKGRLVSESDREKQLRLFAEWVEQTLGPNFALGGKFDVAEFQQWSPDDLRQCSEALNATD